IDVLALVPDLEDIAAEALPLANVTGQDDIGQELHLDDLLPGALALLTAAAGRVEGKESRFISHRPGFARLTEEVADAVHGLRVGGRDGARRRAQRRLVHHDHLVDEFKPAYFFEPVRGLAAPAEVENVVDERALARTRYAGDAGEDPERDPDIDMLQVVLEGVG